jgi:hypothetical protein
MICQLKVKVDGVGGKAVVKEFKWPINSKLPAEDIQELTEILDEYRNVFAFDASELGVMEGETYRIQLIDETPIFKQQYRLSQSEKEILQETNGRTQSGRFHQNVDISMGCASDYATQER